MMPSKKKIIKVPWIIWSKCKFPMISWAIKRWESRPKSWIKNIKPNKRAKNKPPKKWKWTKNTCIALLITSIISLFFLIFSYYLWQKQKTLTQDKTNSMSFTKQLLQNTEEERKRIASDLHDSISHELLNLKYIFRKDSATVNTKINSIINDIRGISRNLHPVMFDKIGLQPNIEQLVERIQQQNDFMVSTEIQYRNPLQRLAMFRRWTSDLSNYSRSSDQYHQICQCSCGKSNDARKSIHYFYRNKR